MSRRRQQARPSGRRSEIRREERAAEAAQEAVEFGEEPAGDGPDRMLGRVAVVGYPNVGKSTLVNRLTGTRTAVVHAEPGVTRDRKEVVCEWNGERFLLIDTGGVDPGDERPIAKQVTAQARVAIAEADVVMLVVDAQAGASAADEEIATMLRRAHVPTVIVANKIDNFANAAHALEFFSLGLGEPVPVSAHHGTNSGDLLDAVVERLREHANEFERPDPSAAITVAILGRPNVGKSTIVNALLGGERVIVSEVAGTTRDSIDTPIRFGDHTVILVDTAGIRRKGSVNSDVEYYSEVRSLQAADRANIAIVVVDASQGLKEADLSIADQARQRDCATLIALNKWDVNDVDLGDIERTVREKLRQRPEVVTTSAVTGRNMEKLLTRVIELHERYSRRISTAEVNKTLAELAQKVSPPTSRRGNKRLKMLYGTQYATAPPRFRIAVNDKGLVSRSYGYYIENQLRERFGFEGCPLIIEFASRR